MIKNLFSFLVILLVTILSFSTLFNILYRSSLAPYSSYALTVRTLIGVTLGNISFDDHDAWASIFLIFFILLTNIILLNLLIAILTNAY